MCYKHYLNRLTTALTQEVLIQTKYSLIKMSFTTLLKLDMILSNDFRCQGNPIKLISSITYVTILRGINHTRDRAPVN